MQSPPVDLFASTLQLGEGGLVRAVDRARSGEDDGWTVAAFRAETNEDVHADHWEMHPEAEEAVCVLAGGARIFLHNNDGPEDVHTLTTGSAFVVPRGRWHRLELDGPADLMSITLRHGTRLAKRNAD